MMLGNRFGTMMWTSFCQYTTLMTLKTSSLLVHLSVVAGNFTIYEPRPGKRVEYHDYLKESTTPALLQHNLCLDLSSQK